MMAGRSEMPNSLKVCCDANFVINWATRPATFAISSKVNEWLRDKRTLIAPSLLFYEVTNALHQARRANSMTLVRSREALEAAASLPLLLVGDSELHVEAAQMALELQLAATYDAHYLALAKRANAEFWTADRRLYNSVRLQLPWVYFIDSSALESSEGLT